MPPGPCTQGSKIIQKFCMLKKTLKDAFSWKTYKTWFGDFAIPINFTLINFSLKLLLLDVFWLQKNLFWSPLVENEGGKGTVTFLYSVFLGRSIPTSHWSENIIFAKKFLLCPFPGNCDACLIYSYFSTLNQLIEAKFADFRSQLRL